MAFAYGAPYTILSNQQIAKIASEKSRGHFAPAFTQMDVALDKDIDIYYVEENAGSPPPILRIAREAVQWARRRGIRKLWIVAAMPHIWRCERDLRYAVKEAGSSIEVETCEEIGQFTENSWYCLNSTQNRTRSAKSWRSQERILKLMPVSIYKLVDS